MGPLVLLDPVARHDLAELRSWHEEQAVFYLAPPTVTQARRVAWPTKIKLLRHPYGGC